MFLARLLAAGALACAGCLLHKYLSNDKRPTLRQTEDTQPVEDVLLEDPVCRRLVSRQQTLVVHHIDTTHISAVNIAVVFFNNRERKKYEIFY